MASPAPTTGPTEAGQTTAPTASATAPVAGVSMQTAGEVAELLEQQARQAFDEHDLQSLLAQVWIDGEVVGTVVLGDAMGGHPATEDGRFRNGAVAIMYVAATMLRMQEDGLIDIDAPIAQWTPDLPAADEVTPRMLANMTAGYPDHVANADFLAAQAADPFRAWTPDEILAYSEATPRLLAPGTNWDYSHAGYFALAEVLEKAGGAPLDELVSRYVLDPLGLDDTVTDITPAMPDPAIHGFTAERGTWEDATFWNPSWTLPPGAVETTTIDDMAASFEAVIG